MEMKNKKPNKLTIIFISALAMAIGLGWVLGKSTNDKHAVSDSKHIHSSSESKKETVWTCSMHPQIKLPKKGQCPICGMNLIPLETDSVAGMPSNRRLVMSPEAAELANIQVSPVEKKAINLSIRMVGKVEYDETKISYITAWTGGRIERLYIDQTGVPVKKGDHMAYIYSPELLSAQEEYLQALESVKNVKASHLDIIRTTSDNTVQNSREKLKLLGITDEQIKELEERKIANENMTIYSAASGIVVGREVQEGDYIKTGDRIYSVVDLSQVWVKLDAYEKDLKWLRYGQEVVFEAEAYPGNIFKGKISLIEPILNEKTRTVKVRVNIQNQDLKLKPGMFVRAKLTAQIGKNDQVLDNNLKGKWIGPMHPEIVRDEPGDCPICEMPLVPAEELGYVSSESTELPLVVPASAVLKTGKRAIVYVQNKNAETPTFEGKEIVVGARANDFYIVKSGLSEGDLVVTNGNFKIDSALQIQAKPSMMNPDGGGQTGGHNHGGSSEETKSDQVMDMAMAPQAFVDQLSSIYESYFKLQESLAVDDFDASKQHLEELNKNLSSPDMSLLTDDLLHAEWMNLSERIKNSIVLGLSSKDIDLLRKDSFEDLSSEILRLEKIFSHSQSKSHFKTFCPMALDGKGAYWLQNKEEIMNPFFGKKMQKCGVVKQNYNSMIEKKTSSQEEKQGMSEGSHEKHEGSHHE